MLNSQFFNNNDNNKATFTVKLTSKGNGLEVKVVNAVHKNMSFMYYSKSSNT